MILIRMVPPMVIALPLFPMVANGTISGAAGWCLAALPLD